MLFLELIGRILGDKLEHKLRIRSSVPLEPVLGPMGLVVVLKIIVNTGK